MKYYSAINYNELLIHAIKRINLTIITLAEKVRKKEHTLRIPFV